MNRTEMLTGICIALLAAAGIGQFTLDRQSLPDPLRPAGVETAQASTPAPAPETKPATVDEVIAAYLGAVEEGSETSLTIALGSLMDELEGPEYSKAAVSREQGEAFVKAAAAMLAKPGDGSQKDGRLRRRLSGFIASRTSGESSRSWVLKVLEEGPEDLREAALRGLGSPTGVRGKAVFEKVAGLGEKGVVDGTVLPRLLVRMGGKKGVEPVVALMRSTDSVKTIAACAIALQDFRDPELLGTVLERLEQIGILERPKTIPWMSAELLAKHLEKAEGSALSRGLKVVKARTSLVKRVVPAIEKALEKGDPETRRIAAEAVKKAVVARNLDPQEGERLLAGRLEAETEPVLKAELTGGLEQIRELLPEPLNAPETRQ